MRILAITNLYPRLGQETRATFNAAQFGALSGLHEVRAIAPVAWTDKVAGLVRLDPRLSHYRNKDGIWVDHPWYFYPPRIAAHRYGEFFLASIHRLAGQVIREFRPDLLLGCWAHPDGWATVQLGRQFGIPAVIKVVGSDVLVATHDERRRSRVAEALCGADAVVAVSRHLAGSVIELGVDQDRVHVVPEGIDHSLFTPGDRASARARLSLPAGGQIVLFVGNLLLSKGAGVLIEACGRLQKQGRVFRCYLVGQGRDEPALRGLIARDGLEQMVTLAGSCPQMGLADWYRSSDVVALPSFSEGIPNVLREAMMCGRRFVATNVGGIPEITTPGVGRLVAARDVDACAAALSEELSHPADADLAEARRLNLSWEQSAELLADVLSSVGSVGSVSRPRRRMPADLLLKRGPLMLEMPPSQMPRSPAVDSASPIRMRTDLGTGALNILAITNLYPNPRQPLNATYNRQQFTALSGRHHLRVVAPIPWTFTLRHPLAARAGWYQNSDGISVLHPIYYFPPKVLEHRWGHCYFHSIIGAIERAIAQRRSDVLLACWAHPDGWAATQIARKYGIPVIVKVHGSDVLVATRNSRRRAGVAEALREADGVVCVSDDLARHVAAFGVKPGKIHIVPNGIDHSLFTPGDRAAARARLSLPAGGQIVLFVGNLLLSKGAGVLIEACGQLKKQGRVFRCHLVGQGRDQPALRALIAREGLEQMVTLAGSCPQIGLADWYRSSDVVALPSFSEGIPNVLREAMMCGRRFVATNVGGIPEITTPGVGRLVAARDVDAFAAALGEELSHPADADLAEARRLNLSWEQSAELLADVLQQAVPNAMRNKPERRAAVASVQLHGAFPETPSDEQLEDPIPALH